MGTDGPISESLSIRIPKSAIGNGITLSLPFFSTAVGREVPAGWNTDSLTCVRQQALIE